MSRQSIDRRIFIVGVPRSGTTLLQSLLAAHSEITSFTESHFFARHFSLWPGFAGPVLTRNPAPRVREFLDENDAPEELAAAWSNDNIPWHLRFRPLLPFQTRSVARRLLAVLDDLAASRDASTWVEKTPRHLRFIPFLERVSNPGPSPRFIHLVRRGQEVVASLHAASPSWERPYDVETCVARWNRDVAYSLSRLDAPNDHFVLYEELTAQTETSLRRLLAELEMPWEDEILQRYGQAAASVVTDDETWKAGVGRSIEPASTFDRALTPSQRQLVDQSLRADLYDQIAAALARRSPGVDGTA